MKREDIVRAAYDAALLLLDIKEKYLVPGKERADMMRKHIKKAKALIERMDSSSQKDDATMAEILHLNSPDSLCDKHQLNWPRLLLW